jgi:hypothetical protein
LIDKKYYYLNYKKEFLDAYVKMYDEEYALYDLNKIEELIRSINNK